MEYWTCNICDIEMQMLQRTPHLSGKRHAAATGARHERLLQEQRPQEAAQNWVCTVCEIEMQIQNRESHLSGRRHLLASNAFQQRQEKLLQERETREREAREREAREREAREREAREREARERETREKEAREREAQEKKAQEKEARERETQKPARQWNCNICNIQMQIQNRDSHLSGNRHQIAIQSRQRESHPEIKANYNSITPSSTTLRVFPTARTVDGITGGTLYSIPSLSEVYGTSVPDLWVCTMCGCCIPLFDKQSHLSGVDHIQKLLKTIKATFLAIPQPQVESNNHDIGGKKKQNDQDAVDETKTLVAYLTKLTSSRDAQTTTSFSATDSLLQSRVKSTPSSSISPLDKFFHSFSWYQYDPSLPPAESFNAFRKGLRRWGDYDGNSDSAWKEYKEDVFERYQAALTQEFNLWFGTEDDIKSWHSLCRAIAIRPLPTTLEACREAVENRHVNIVDLIRWAREREVGQVQIFKTVKELSKYSYDEGKIYHREQRGQGAVLTHLLRYLWKERPVDMY